VRIAASTPPTVPAPPGRRPGRAGGRRARSSRSRSPPPRAPSPGTPASAPRARPLAAARRPAASHARLRDVQPVLACPCPRQLQLDVVPARLPRSVEEVGARAAADGLRQPPRLELGRQPFHLLRARPPQ